MTNYPPLARLLPDQPRQPEGFVDEPSVSGRSRPRPEPLPEGFAHDVRFHGAVGGVGLSVYCQPCHWGSWIDDGHDLADLIKLTAQHAGAADVTVTATESLLALLQPLVVAS